MFIILFKKFCMTDYNLDKKIIEKIHLQAK